MGASRLVRRRVAKTRLLLLGTLFFGCCALAAENDFDSFAELSHYESANAALMPDSSRVVFIGDSITASWVDEPLFTNNPQDRKSVV